MILACLLMVEFVFDVDLAYFVLIELHLIMNNVSTFYSLVWILIAISLFNSR